MPSATASLPKTTTAQQGNDALKQQVGQLNDQIAGRKTEQAGLDKAGRRSSGHARQFDGGA